MATNLTLMQQFLTLFYHILAKWHSFAHSGMWDWQIKKITFIHSLILIWTIKKILRAGQHIIFKCVFRSRKRFTCKIRNWFLIWPCLYSWWWWFIAFRLSLKIQTHSHTLTQKKHSLTILEVWFHFFSQFESCLAKLK